MRKFKIIAQADVTENNCYNLNCGSEYDCNTMYNCCDCGGEGCGCGYCFSCNACDHCLKEHSEG